MKRFVRLLTGLFVSLAATLISGAIEQTVAQSSSGPSTEQNFEDALDRVDDDFGAFGWPPHGWIQPFPEATEAYVEFNRKLWNEYGILYSFSPTVMMQAGTQGGSQNFTANEQYQGFFAWRFLNNTPIGSSYFLANNLHVSQLTRVSGVNFSQSIGLNYFTSDSVANTNVVKSLLLRHEFPDDILTVSFGHAEIGSVDAGCRYFCDDTASFYSTPLSANPTRTLPGQGTAILAELKLFDGVYLEGGVADALGDGKVNFSRVFQTGDLAYAGALKFENLAPDLGYGMVKLTYYAVDATRQGTPNAQVATQGVSLQIEQDFGEIGVFGRYSRAFKRFSSAKQTAAGGLVWTKPFGMDEDWLGVGVGWVEPTAKNTSNEYAAELFYRAQITPFFQITPSVMLTVNSSSKASHKTAGVFSLRVKGLF